MKKIAIILIFLLIPIFSFSNRSRNEFDTSIIENIKPTVSEIPPGYMFGKIPHTARKVFKGNPWLMDSKTVRKLSNRIYPGGNYRNISKIHITIITNITKPYSDDIVCYLLLFKSRRTAQKELAKLNKFVSYNKDRTILLAKKNLAVFLNVDDAEDFHYIRQLAEEIENKLNGLVTK